jgi:hypothetical protein
MLSRLVKILLVIVLLPPALIAVVIILGMFLAAVGALPDPKVVVPR